MNPGKLNRRVIIQSRTKTRDATGSTVSTWADESTVWAEAVTHKSSEAEIVDSDRTQQTRQFRIRHRTITSEDHRILYQSQFFNITGITEEGIRNTLLLDTVATKAIG
jgi:SPP1 family predicted phage head-tail adaptor